MKLAFVGNMNNLLAINAQYMSDYGHNVTLFLLDEMEHFHPKHALDNINFTIVDTGWKKEQLPYLKKNKILNILGGFDAYFTTHWAPALLHKAGLKSFIFAPAGTDIIDFPFYSPKTIFPKDWQFDKIKISQHQKEGIINASYMCFKPVEKDSPFNHSYQFFKNKVSLISFLPYIYFSTKKLNVNIPTNIKNIRKEADILLFQHGRQTWNNRGIHNKGNDILFRGMRQFILKNPSINLMCIALEYGKDVEKSKQLCKQLGIEKHIHWIPKMPRKELLKILPICDAGVGTLSKNFFAYGAAIEIIAGKIPLIHFAKSKIKNIYPSLHAEDKNSMENSIKYLVDHKIEAKQMAEKAYQWVYKNLKEIPLAFVEKSLKRNIDNRTKWSLKLKCIYAISKIMQPINKYYYGIKSKLSPK